MDYTQIISAVIALISALISAFLIPWIKTKIDADKLQTVRTYVEIGVKAAEQLYAASEGDKKKAYVISFLAGKGIKFDVETVDKLIEAAVRFISAVSLRSFRTHSTGAKMRRRANRNDESIGACAQAY